MFYYVTLSEVDMLSSMQYMLLGAENALSHLKLLKKPIQVLLEKTATLLFLRDSVGTFLHFSLLQWNDFNVRQEAFHISSTYPKQHALIPCALLTQYQVSKITTYKPQNQFF